MSPFDRITKASSSARDQFSVLGKMEDNAEIIKELATEMIGALSSLIHSTGGDNDYLEPWFDGVTNDIDLCFRAELQAREETIAMFKPRRGLGRALSHGAR